MTTNATTVPSTTTGARAPTRATILLRTVAFILDAALILATWSSAVAIAYFGLFPVARLVNGEEVFMLLFDSLGSLPSPLRREMGVTNLGTLGLGTFLLLTLVALAYFSFFEGRRGATPGKLILGLRVVTTSGGTISRRQSLIRNATKALFFGMPLLILVDAVFAMFHPRRHRVTEIPVRTEVIETGQA